MATDRIFVGIIALGVLGFLADRIFERLVRTFARRYQPQ
jgi:NitT/TauT family transport system permease protein